MFEKLGLLQRQFFKIGHRGVSCNLRIKYCRKRCFAVIEIATDFFTVTTICFVGLRRPLLLR